MGLSGQASRRVTTPESVSVLPSFSCSMAPNLRRTEGLPHFLSVSADPWPKGFLSRAGESQWCGWGAERGAAEEGEGSLCRRGGLAQVFSLSFVRDVRFLWFSVSSTLPDGWL